MHTERKGARVGFTIVDLLVSIAIIAVLIGILLPSLSMVRETSERVVCASNLRQTGLGLHMYATDNAEFLPPSSFSLGNGESWNTNPLQLRIDAGLRGNPSENRFFWDGLGFLYQQDYLSDGRVFYCPSHLGENTFENFAPQFNGEIGDIVANYQYRGRGPNGEEKLDLFSDHAALVSDGFLNMTDINHADGMNVLRAGMSVRWFRDLNLEAMSTALMAGDDGGWENRWELLDNPDMEPRGGWFWD
jgi:type II secretory pathway pseudopilin PulG